MGMPCQPWTPYQEEMLKPHPILHQHMKCEISPQQNGQDMVFKLGSLQVPWADRTQESFERGLAVFVNNSYSIGEITILEYLYSL